MKITTTTHALTTAFAGAIIAGSAGAATLQLNPEFDSSIRSDQATTTQSGSAILFAGDTTGAILRSVFSFDLNQPELAGATINSATLTLFVRSNDGNNPGTFIDVNLHDLSGGFDNAVTWNTRDGVTAWGTAGGDFGTLLDTINADPGSAVIGSQFVFDGAALTSLTTGAIGGDLTLLLKSGSEDTSARNLFWFRSNEDTANTPPLLTIDYTPVPEPGSLALLGLGGLCMLRRRRG